MSHGPLPITSTSLAASFSFDRERVGAWAAERIPYVTTWGDWYQAIGLERDGELIAATVYNFYSGSSIAMSFAAVPGRRWLTRAYLATIFRYPFVQLGVRRVTGFIASRNTNSIRFAEHLGAKREGLMRDALPDDDLLVYGLLRSECRYGQT